MLTKSKRVTRILAVAASALMTAGCFGGSGDGDKKVDKGEYTQMNKNPGDPVQGGTMVITNTSDAKSADPHTQSTYNTHNLVGPVYSKLLEYASGADIEFGLDEIVGDLAEKWESSKNGLTWTFHLRQGVKFHNVAPVNGREFKSSDVKCTMDRIMEKGFQKYLLNPVETIEYPDDYTVIFKLKIPYATFDKSMANHFMEILPCEATQGLIDLNSTAIGTGPFMLTNWQRDVERTYKAHPEYYEEGVPYLDGVRWVIMPDVQAQAAALRSGNIDYTTAAASDKRQLDQITQQVEGSQVAMELGLTQNRVYVNMEKPPFDDIKVRRAIYMAIDREAMMKTVRLDGRISGPIAPLLEGALSTEELLELTPYDPEKSKELLAEAGYPDGFETTMMVTPGYGPTVVQEAQWVQEDLSKVGIKATLDVQEYATYFTDSWPNKKYEMAFGLQTPYLTGDEYLFTEYPSDGTRNWFGINDPELDSMIKELESATLDERKKLLKDIQLYIIENISNPMPMYTYATAIVYSPRLRNYWASPQYGRQYWKYAWVTDGK